MKNFDSNQFMDDDFNSDFDLDIEFDDALDIDEEHNSNLDHDHSLPVDESLTEAEDEHTEEEPQASPESSNTSLADSCLLTIEAQAGHINLSLQQLLSLTQGQTLDIAPLPPKVKLLINGVVIGDGFLVELNGRVGVKIANLSGQGLTNAH